MESESPRKRIKVKPTWEFTFGGRARIEKQLNLKPSSFSDKDSARAFMDQVWERSYCKRKNIDEQTIYSTMLRRIQEDSGVIKFIEKWQKMTLPEEELQSLKLESEDKLQKLTEAFIALAKAKEKLREVSQVKTEPEC